VPFLQSALFRQPAPGLSESALQRGKCSEQIVRLSPASQHTAARPGQQRDAGPPEHPATVPLWQVSCPLQKIPSSHPPMSLLTNAVFLQVPVHVPVPGTISQVSSVHGLLSSHSTSKEQKPTAQGTSTFATPPS